MAIKIDTQVIRKNPIGFKQPTGQVIEIVQGGFEVCWDNGQHLVSFENLDSIAERFPGK